MGHVTTYNCFRCGDVVRFKHADSRDAAGVTIFAYDDFGAVTNETVIGVAGTNTIVRFWNDYGRTTGYALNGTRQTTIGYDSATARIESMLANGSDTPFTWSYYPGSDLKSSLFYPNSLTASWQYDANNRLLQVCNAFDAETEPPPSRTNLISQYDYAYDAAGRRVQISRSGSAMSEARTDIYGYNARSELVSASKTVGRDDPSAPQPVPATVEYAYQYDDIGNRISSTEQSPGGSQSPATAYTANSLNQYTSISTSDFGLQTSGFTPQFDDDVLLWGQTSQQG